MRSLAEALPDAPFAERHERVLHAPPEQIWSDLMSLRLTDLSVSRLLVRVRYLGRPQAEPAPMVQQGPVVVLSVEPGHRWVGGRIAQPWRLRPRAAPDPADLNELAVYAEPGWLKMGLEFVLEPVGTDRTVLTTTTLCAPTDPNARRRFAPYWRLIRPFSGLIRRDILATMARRHPSPDRRRSRDTRMPALG